MSEEKNYFDDCRKIVDRGSCRQKDYKDKQYDGLIINKF